MKGNKEVKETKKLKGRYNLKKKIIKKKTREGGRMGTKARREQTKEEIEKNMSEEIEKVEAEMMKLE